MISIYTWMHERNEKRNVKKKLLMALCSPKSRAPGSVKGLVQIIYPGGGGGQGGVATGSQRPGPPPLQSAAGRARQNGGRRQPRPLAPRTGGERPGRGENGGQNPGRLPGRETRRTPANSGEAAGATGEGRARPHPLGKGHHS